MPFPKLSPLQSRLAASLFACVVVLLLYLTLSSSHFAYASDVESIILADYNHERLLQSYVLDSGPDNIGQEVGYEAEFFGTDKSIIGRAPPGVSVIENNHFVTINVEQGGTVHYMFSNSSQTLYITINTCLQPFNPNDPNGSNGPPGQLELYVSQDIPTPGPGQNGSQQMVQADGGFANITIEAIGDVFIGVYAPVTPGFINVYNVEIAASTDAPFHFYNSSQSNLYFIDSDSNTALLVSGNLTNSTNSSSYDDLMSLTPPSVIFVVNQNQTTFAGVQNSYCGLENFVQSLGTDAPQVQTSVTDVIFGSPPKPQFYVQGLNRSSSYNAILAMAGNSTDIANGVVGGSRGVWKTRNFQTQSDGNCKLIFNLSFCSSVAYAVPGNPSTYPKATDLAAFYDGTAQEYYTNFTFNMQQIPCEIDSTGQYSLARNCNDCNDAYKIWLCSVMIPRCKDYSSTAIYLQARNIVQPFPNSTTLDPNVISQVQSYLYLNSSRNQLIDQLVQPGPYKELLPCDDLCYGIVQSCPAALGFSCPRPGQLGFNYSYGVRPPRDSAEATCNYPGAINNLNGGSVRRVPLVSGIAVVVLLGVILQ